MILSLDTTFTTYLLKDDYDIDENDTAKVVGNIGLIGDITSICTVFFFGYAVELFGRKKMLVGGLLVTGTAIICKPLPNSLTGLYFLSVISSVAVIPVLYTPYTVDYVQ